MSRGVSIGKAHIVERAELEIREYLIDEKAAADEIRRLRDAIRQAKDDLRSVRDQIPETTSADIAAFIDTHLLMLEDSALTFDAERLIKERHCNAEWALKLQRDALVRAFDEMDDPYLRTRKDDVDHVVSRIQRILLKHEPLTHETPGARLADMIIVADDLTPADAVLMERHGVTGFVTEFGGQTSHMSILARSLGIPGVVGAHGVTRYLRENETIVVDANEGVVIADPDDNTLAFYRERQSAYRRRESDLTQLRDARTVTLDGTEVHLQANVELPVDFSAAHDVGAAGVGLYRTEFLYLNRLASPDEAEHFDTYRELISAMRGMPVTIRTLDLGADKDFDIGMPIHESANPALGLRAIRLALKEPDLYWPQLRAVCRASAFGPVRLMFPMLSNIDEVRQVVENVRSVQNDLQSKGIEYDPDMALGAMIEVPAAAICADAFAQHLDFLSIGTNDLIQYTIAIDRVNDAVNYLYNPLNPAVLRLISLTIDAGTAAGIPVSMCGEMAGDIRYTKLLLGLGLREFSVHPSLLLEVRDVINRLRLDDVKAIARELLTETDPSKFDALIDRLS